MTQVEDVQWVQYPLTALVGISDRLDTITEELTATLLQLEQDLLTTLLGQGNFSDSAMPANETLTFALEKYHGFPLSHRHKRGLFDGLRHLSRRLFGTAMNEEVEELRDRYNHSASLDSVHNKANVSVPSTFLDLKNMCMI